VPDEAFAESLLADGQSCWNSRAIATSKKIVGKYVTRADEPSEDERRDHPEHDRPRPEGSASALLGTSGA
jgi:hypothetical protein